MTVIYFSMDKIYNRTFQKLHLPGFLVQQDNLDELANASGTEFEIPASFDEQVCPIFMQDLFFYLGSWWRHAMLYLLLFNLKYYSLNKFEHHLYVLQIGIDSHMGADWPGT